MDVLHQKTRAAFVWTRLLRTPFWAIYGMLPFILYRDLGATPLQVAVAVALKPTVSIASVYWSAAVDGRPDRLVMNIIWAGALGLLPFFFFPFVSDPWFYVGAFGFFMLLHRGVIPAWMEILRRNVPGQSREKLFAYSSAAGYLGDAALPLALGWLLDGYHESWRWLFPLTASISLFAIIFQLRIPIVLKKEIAKTAHRIKLLEPWKRAWILLKERPDFRAFQWGFMWGGAGLMVMHAVIPMFYVDVLHISYTELAIAITLCKGIGFAMASPLWADWMGRVDLYRFCSLVTALAFLFPLFLVGAPLHMGWLFGGYLCYGIMQAGSELSWNLSGPIFAGNQESSLYSSVNVLMVGVRGCLAPALGTCCYYMFGALPTLLFGALFCLIATVSLAYRGSISSVLDAHSSEY